MSERELDQILDAALQGYLAEAPSGLPERVLARVRRPRVWPWAAGLAAAAAMAIAVLLPRPAAVDRLPITVAHAPAAPAVRLTAITPAARRGPRPVPLSRRERLLIRFVQSNPELAQRIFVEAPKQMAQDLKIDPITIEPLDTGGE